MRKMLSEFPMTVTLRMPFDSCYFAGILSGISLIKPEKKTHFAIKYCNLSRHLFFLNDASMVLPSFIFMLGSITI